MPNAILLVHNFCVDTMLHSLNKIKSHVNIDEKLLCANNYVHTKNCKFGVCFAIYP